MTKFINGSAAGVPLMLRRAPLFLRVVQSEDGGIDALDQLDDVPSATEVITAYRLVENSGMVHVCSRGKNRGASGYYPMASYELCDDQPGDEGRDAAKWQAWCNARAEAWVAARAERRAKKDGAE